MAVTSREGLEEVSMDLRRPNIRRNLCFSFISGAHGPVEVELYEDFVAVETLVNERVLQRWHLMLLSRYSVIITA